MRVRAVVVAVALLAAGSARAQAALDLEVTFGGRHLGLAAPAAGDTAQPTGDLGATLLLVAGPLAIGAAAATTTSGIRRYDASALAGLAFPVLPVIRLELLAELGAADLHSAKDIPAALGGAVTGEAGWHRFWGVRPGLSIHIPELPFRVGLWGLARWGLPGTGPGPVWGVLGRIGLEF